MSVLQYLQLLSTAITAVASGKDTISFDGYSITATNNGAPVKFTFASALLALEELVLSNFTNLSFQIGSTLIVVSKA